MAKKQESSNLRNDPLTVFCFKVSISALGAEMYFRSVSGLKSESEVVDYKEGGLNSSTRRLMGPVKWPNLVLKKGFTGKLDGKEMTKWRDLWIADDPLTPLKRVDGTIIQLDSALKPKCQWHFYRGWPCKWEGPELDATKSELAIETLEIAHEGLVFEKA